MTEMARAVQAAGVLLDVPTTRELGYGPEADFRSWHVVVVRPGTPAPILDRLFQAVTGAVTVPSVRVGMLRAGIEPAPCKSVEAAQAFYLEGLRRWEELIRAIGVRARRGGPALDAQNAAPSPKAVATTVGGLPPSPPKA